MTRQSARPVPSTRKHPVAWALVLAAALTACSQGADAGNAADASTAGGGGGSGGGGAAGGANAGGGGASTRDGGPTSPNADMRVQVERCVEAPGPCTPAEADRLCYLTECEEDPYWVYYRCDGTQWSYESQDGYDCGDWEHDAYVPPPGIDAGSVPVEPDATPVPQCPYDAHEALGPCTPELEGVECWQTDCPRNSPDPASWSRICVGGEWVDGQSNGADCLPTEDSCASLDAVEGGVCPPEYDHYACDQDRTCLDGRVEPESLWCLDGAWSSVNSCFDE